RVDQWRGRGVRGAVGSVVIRGRVERADDSSQLRWRDEHRAGRLRGSEGREVRRRGRVDRAGDHGRAARLPPLEHGRPPLMHRLSYTTRQIADADLPTVRDPDGTLRPASHQDLLNLGIKPLGGGYYACAEQERSEGPDAVTIDPVSGRVRRNYTPHGPRLPGTVVTRGTPAQRHAALPDH